MKDVKMMHMLNRAFQFLMKLLSFLMPFREPKIIRTIEDLPFEINRLNLNRIMIVTDQGVVRAGLLQMLVDILHKNNIDKFFIYSRVQSEPNNEHVEDGYRFYLSHQCDSFIALGGGNPIDFAKAVGIKAVRPKVQLTKLKGLFKVIKKIPPLIAIPTTAGTGSEVSIVCSLTDKKTSMTFTIIGFALVPLVAVLDPKLTFKLPPYLTAITGMDTLTHAVEAYLNRYHTRKTKKCALSAMTNVFQYLTIAYENPTNLEARTKMLQASHDAGYAYTRDAVGYIHAMSHALGGYHHISHGYANAIIMPYVLKAYGKRVERKLADLHDDLWASKVKRTNTQKANHFIKHVETLNRRLMIPDHIILSHDYHMEEMVELIQKEVRWNYPVPKIFSKKEIQTLLSQVVRIKK